MTMLLENPPVSPSTTDLDEPTVEEMIADAEHDDADSLGARLDAVRHTITEDGVSVTVDLHGKLVDLHFDGSAMRMRAAQLTTLLQRLADRAAAGAVADGLAILAERCHPDLIAQLSR